MPIGSQQAVKHHLADAPPCSCGSPRPPCTGRRGPCRTGDPNAARAVSAAKSLASDAARFTARQALQCHGAIGYTVECDLHLYLKRAEAPWSASWGDAAWHRRRVATSLGI